MAALCVAPWLLLNGCPAARWLAGWLRPTLWAELAWRLHLLRSALVRLQVSVGVNVRHGSKACWGAAPQQGLSSMLAHSWLAAAVARVC